MKLLTIILCLVLSFGLIGCASYLDGVALKAGYTRLNHAQQELAAVKADAETRIKNATDKVATEKDGLIQQMRANFQEQSNWTYKIFLAEELNLNRNRRDDIIYFSAQTALKVGLSPSVEAILSANESLKKELDETVTSNAQLLAQYKQAQDDAAAKAKLLTERDASLAAAEKAKKDAEDKAKTDIQVAQDQVTEKQNKVISLEHQRGDDHDAIVAMKTKLSMGAGLLAVLAVAGAVYGPLSTKIKCGIFAGICSFLAIAIWYVDGTVVVVVVAVAVVAFAAWMAYSHWTLDKTNKALVNTNDQIKLTNPTGYETVVAPVLAENTTTYKKVGDEIITVPDKGVLAQIDKTLMASDRK